MLTGLLYPASQCCARVKRKFGIGMPPSSNSPGSPRILYLSWRDRENPEAGGSETFVERTSAVMSEQGADVTIMTASFPGADARTWHDRVRVLRAGNRFTCYVAGLWHALRHARSYDVIIDVQNGVPFWSPLVAKVTKTPVIAVVHHVHEDQWKTFFPQPIAAFGWWLESTAAPFVYRSCRYITVSKATRSELVSLGVDRERIDLIYSGNDHPDDLARYDAMERSVKPSITVLGRLVPHKQVEIAIETVATLRQEFPGLHLNVVGSGAWQPELEALVAKLQLTDSVSFLGFVDEDTKHTVLAQSWVVMMPSYKEGWGLTIIEAGLHGTPSVAFAQAGGPRESIQHGRTGALATTTEEMVDDVRVLLGDAAIRNRLGAQARTYAAGFSWEATGKQVLQTVNSVLGRGPRAVQLGDDALETPRLRAMAQVGAFSDDRASR